MCAEIDAADPLVVAVVLNWNKAEQSTECVRSLRRQTYHNLRIVVVDNGSDAGSLSPLRELGDSIRLFCNETNLGFTGGVNVGIHLALVDGAEFIWLVNNDAKPAPDALDLMITGMRADPEIGLASPVIRNADAANEIEFHGGVWTLNGIMSATDDPNLYNDWVRKAPDRIWLVGTALLLRRKLVDAIGFFDERFFAYWEDNDYCMRSSRAGFRNVVVPTAEVFHSSGIPKTDPASKPPHYHYYMARNEILFLRKHLRARDALKPMYWAFRRHYRQIWRLYPAPSSSEAVVSGLWDGFMGRTGSYDARQKLAPWCTHILRAFTGATRHHQ